MWFYYVLACAVMAVHALFILWVIFGAAVTGSHPLLRWLHIISLVWGVWIEAGPWPCPLTWAENWLELRAGVNSYQGGFLLHYLDRIVYPNIPSVWLTEAAVVVAIVNVWACMPGDIIGRERGTEVRGSEYPAQPSRHRWRIRPPKIGLPAPASQRRFHLSRGSGSEWCPAQL